jgi:uncharacterized protein YjgD (DUF1641 family)
MKTISKIKDTNKISDEKNRYLNRISEIVDQLIKLNDVFKELNKKKLMDHLLTLIEKVPQDEFSSITDNELTRRIDKVMAVEAMSGMLNDLTPEQIKSFDAAVKRKKLFR